MTIQTKGAPVNHTNTTT